MKKAFVHFLKGSYAHFLWKTFLPDLWTTGLFRKAFHADMPSAAKDSGFIKRKGSASLLKSEPVWKSCGAESALRGAGETIPRTQPAMAGERSETGFSKLIF